MTDQSDDEPVAVLEIEDSIDLHGFQPREIPEVVLAYLDAASEKGFTEVRVIHGRGTGFQRMRVRQVLAAHPRVLEVENAPASRGGWGATIVRLAPAERKP